MKRVTGIIVFSLLLVVVTYVGLLAFYFESMPNRGLFGDMFGGLNALFSGVALIGVVYTSFLQKQELELTRKELMRTAEAQEK